MFAELVDERTLPSQKILNSWYSSPATKVLYAKKYKIKSQNESLSVVHDLHKCAKLIITGGVIEYQEKKYMVTKITKHLEV